MTAFFVAISLMWIAAATIMALPHNIHRAEDASFLPYHEGPCYNMTHHTNCNPGITTATATSTINYYCCNYLYNCCCPCYYCNSSVVHHSNRYDVTLESHGAVQWMAVCPCTAEPCSLAPGSNGTLIIGFVAGTYEIQTMNMLDVWLDSIRSCKYTCLLCI